MKKMRAGCVLVHPAGSHEYQCGTTVRDFDVVSSFVLFSSPVHKSCSSFEGRSIVLKGVQRESLEIRVKEISRFDVRSWSGQSHDSWDSDWSDDHTVGRVVLRW